MGPAFVEQRHLTMRGLALALMLCLCLTRPGVAQTAGSNYVERRLDGSELAHIITAWDAVEREFAPPRPLTEFSVGYIERDGVISVWFFRPNTTSRAENGDIIIRHDSLYYSAVIENGSVRVAR